MAFLESPRRLAAATADDARALIATLGGRLGGAPRVTRAALDARACAVLAQVV